MLSVWLVKAPLVGGSGVVICLSRRVASTQTNWSNFYGNKLSDFSFASTERCFMSGDVDLKLHARCCFVHVDWMHAPLHERRFHPHIHPLRRGYSFLRLTVMTESLLTGHCWQVNLFLRPRHGRLGPWWRTRVRDSVDPLNYAGLPTGDTPLVISHYSGLNSE